MSRLSRLTVTLLAATLLLVACGGKPVAEEAPEPTAAPTEATAVLEAEPTEGAAEPTNTSEEEAASDEDAEPTEAAPEEANDAATTIMTDDASLVVVDEMDETRIIRHLFGETEVPINPQRIVALQDQNVFLPLLELGEGERVVGSAGGQADDGTPIFRRTQNYDTSGVTLVGGVFEPNLEVIAELNPDLIIGNQIRKTQADYDLLSEIAPTVIVEQFDRPIWGSLFDIALLVDAQDEAIALKAAYDERIAGMQAALDNPSEITVSVIVPLETGFIVESGRFGPDRTVIPDMGLSFTPFWQETIESGEGSTLSLESIELVDGDVVYVYDFGAKTESLVEAPVYNTLNAVQKGQAHLVDPENVAGNSPQALNGWLDVFEETLLVDSFDTSWEPTE